MNPKSKKVKNQHYVPRCYLKNFLNKNGKIGVFDKQRDRIFQTNINNIASQNYFYDIPENEILDIQCFEKMFNDFETDYGNISKNLFNSLNSIKNDTFNSVLDNYREFFAFYFCLQWTRTLQTRKLTSYIFKTTLEQIKDTLGYKDCEIIVHEDKLMPIQAHFILNILSEEKILYLANQQFFIFINSTKFPFYCSDNPAIMDSSFCKKDGRGKGLFSFGMNFYLPLSNKYCLLIADRNLFKPKIQCNTIILQDYNDIKYINDLQIKKATNQIYCNDCNIFKKEKVYIKSVLNPL